MTSTYPRKRRWKKWGVGLLVVLIGMLVAGELVARFYLGLGDPPLSVADPEIEYLFKPNQDVSRFGNRIAYNAYSMRSDAFPQQKQDAASFRVLVLGDSVINGGSLTDQSELATALLQDSLAQTLGRPVTVGNVSAGSWGPGNLLAYVERNGLFDADLVVLVLSSHDAGDVPTFEPIVGTPNFPSEKPRVALEEVVTRYLPRYLPMGGGESREPEAEGDPLGAIDVLKSLIATVQDQGVDLLIAQHPEKDELAGPKQAGFDAIAAAAASRGVPTIDLAPAFENAPAAGGDLYRDYIHPTAEGHRVLAQALHRAIVERLDAQDDGAE